MECLGHRCKDDVCCLLCGGPSDWAPSEAPKNGAHIARIDHGARPVETLGQVQAAEQFPMEFVPHPKALPVAQPAPASHAAATTQFLWQVLPGHAVVDSSN